MADRSRSAEWSEVVGRSLATRRLRRLRRRQARHFDNPAYHRRARVHSLRLQVRQLRLSCCLTCDTCCGVSHPARVGLKRQLLQRKCADILQPDVTWVGGLTECRRIVALCAAFDIPVRFMRPTHASLLRTHVGNRLMLTCAQVIPHGSSVFSYHMQYAFPNCPMAEV